MEKMRNDVVDRERKVPESGKRREVCREMKLPGTSRVRKLADREKV